MLCPPWRRPGRGLSDPRLGPRAAAVAREAEAAAAVAGRARRPARRGEGVISGQEAEAGSSFSSRPPISAAKRPPGLNRALSSPAVRSPARPHSLPGPQGLARGPLPAAAALPGFPPRGGGSS
ncbi:unnamed protein product [Rangifer tarandus platyrhynchus]|uniref:Uncharacterized protein n=1 Tax=Rangifer tarandus platyrhynchus TaxID=3082113 RepID=A0ABN8YMI5_RANTA|nr:unnamed protein product [Rangifer tarandus platyrhynchus]